MEKNKKIPTIFLAGDSTVKTYDKEVFISGWGQFLGSFLSENIKVVNCSNGGRSSRMFINEGRLININDKEYKYNFSQNDGKSIEDSIQKGDYLFIQFGHNDDETYIIKGYQTMYNRMVPLGDIDNDGKISMSPGIKVSTSHLPRYYLEHASKEEIEDALKEISSYGSKYYSYDCGGTYKWYLKQFVDFARRVEAIPVLVTPPARINFDGNKIVGDNGCHGKNFEYVEAVRQLAKEQDCLLIDLFSETVKIYEIATKKYAKYLMSFVPKESSGLWPNAYDDMYGHPEKGFVRGESTHFNKFGAYLLAGKVIELILNNNHSTKNNEKFEFKEYIKNELKNKIVPSSLIDEKIVTQIKKIYKLVNI